MKGIKVNNNIWRLKSYGFDIIGKLQDKIFSLVFFCYKEDGETIESQEVITFQGEQACDFDFDFTNIRDAYVVLFTQKGFDLSLIPEDMNNEVYE